jgi:ABC-type lipoprotein export system ATPase subunit
MAQHLVTTGETAPLILDEVTAQADDTRRDALIGVLHELSRERQVILFTHDPWFAEWAGDHLDPARDVVVPLAGRPAAAF